MTPDEARAQYEAGYRGEWLCKLRDPVYDYWKVLRLIGYLPIQEPRWFPVVAASKESAVAEQDASAILSAYPIDWLTSEPPKDGRELRLRLDGCEVVAAWDTSRCCWMYSDNGYIEESYVSGWKPCEVTAE